MGFCRNLSLLILALFEHPVSFGAGSLCISLRLLGESEGFFSSFARCFRIGGSLRVGIFRLLREIMRICQKLVILIAHYPDLICAASQRQCGGNENKCIAFHYTFLFIN